MSIVVTGASGALGQEVCNVLAENGFEVAPIRGVDLTDADAAQRAISEIADSAGPIHGLVNIAGGFAWETVMDGDVSTWDRMWAMNVQTALNACRSTVPFLGTGGSIVNIGSAAAAKADFGKGAYAASKSGVARLTESLAEELKSKGVRVNAILPSIIDTPAARRGFRVLGNYPGTGRCHCVSFVGQSQRHNRCAYRGYGSYLISSAN